MTTALRIAGFPGRYIQGPGALQVLGAQLREMTTDNVLLVSDDVVDAVVGVAVRDELVTQGFGVQRLRFAGECTRAAIAELITAAREPPRQRCIVVGLGGGKALDTAKGVAKGLGLPLVIVPTIASNDAPTSRLIVLYDTDHRLLGVELLERNPALVLVDTALIAQAPVRFLRAGLGDALSKKFEAAACAAAGGTNFHGGRPPWAATALAERGYELIATRGEDGLAAAAAGHPSDALEAIIEAAVLCSGIGFESGGLSIAHALVRGFSAVPSLAAALHGEAVAFGTVVQMLLEPRPPQEVEGHLRLLQRLGMRVSLESLGHDPRLPPDLDTITAATMQAPYLANFNRPLAAAPLKEAIREADRRLRAIEGRNPY